MYRQHVFARVQAAVLVAAGIAPRRLADLVAQIPDLMGRFPFGGMHGNVFESVDLCCVVADKSTVTQQLGLGQRSIGCHFRVERTHIIQQQRNGITAAIAVFHAQITDMLVLHQTHPAHPIPVKDAEKADLTQRDLLMQIAIGRYAARKSFPSSTGLQGAFGFLETSAGQR